MAGSKRLAPEKDRAHASEGAMGGLKTSDIDDGKDAKSPNTNPRPGSRPAGQSTQMIVGADSRQ